MQFSPWKLLKVIDHWPVAAMYLNSVQTTFSTNVIENLNPRGLQGISDLRILSLANFGQKRQKTRWTATERQQSRKATTTESERLETRQRGGDEAQTGNIKRTPLKPDSAVSRGRARSQGTVSAAVPVKGFRRLVFFHSWRRNDNSTRMSWGQPPRTGHPCSFFSMVATRTRGKGPTTERGRVESRQHGGEKEWQQNAHILKPGGLDMTPLLPLHCKPCYPALDHDHGLGLSAHNLIPSGRLFTVYGLRQAETFGKTATKFWEDQLVTQQS